MARELQLPGPMAPRCFWPVLVGGDIFPGARVYKLLQKMYPASLSGAG